MRVLFAAEPHRCTATALRSLADALQLDESQLAIAVVAPVETLVQCLGPLVGIAPAHVREDALKAAATAARRAAACAPQRATVCHLVVEAWAEVESLVASGGHDVLALAALPPRWRDRRGLLTCAQRCGAPLLVLPGDAGLWQQPRRAMPAIAAARGPESARE